MAKRRKKTGGGAFGKAGKSGAAFSKHRPLPAISVRDSERMNKMIQKIIASKDFGSFEEMQRFLDQELSGRHLEELEAMLPQDGPQSNLDRAESLIDGIPEGTAPEEVVRIAKEALALSEDCMGAWFEYGVYAEDTATALERFELGIERGRVRFEDEIRQSGIGRGLWGYVEARDFMRLMHEKAKALVELRQLEKAIEVYQEMLVLNPSDNQGIRGDLLRTLMIHRRLDEARGLLDRFPDDAMVDIAYGRAFLEIVETVEKTGYEIPDANGKDAPASPAALLKSLGPEFKTAVKLLNEAVKTNPFVPLFMTHGSLLEVEVDDVACYGGPYEAVSYAQRWCLLWYVSGLPFLLMAGVSPGNLKRFLKAPHLSEELFDVTGQLEDLDLADAKPWWTAIEEHPDA